MKIKNKCFWYPLIGVIIVAVLGGLFMMNSSELFNKINTPSFMPPGFVFSIAWIIIYICAFFAMYFSCKEGDGENIGYMFLANGILNVLWTFVFVNNENFRGGIIIIILMIATLIYIIAKSGSLKTRILLLPYILWLFVALALNYAIILIN